MSLDDTVVPAPGRGERALLSLLALDVGRTVSNGRLIDSLWEGALPADPINALQLRVSKLRRLVGAAVVTMPGGYRLDIPRERVDVHRFRQLVARARPHDALDLWYGTPLAEFTGVRWADAERTALEQERLHAVADRVDEDLAAGRHAMVLPELERLVEQHPGQEAFWAQLMVARYRDDQQRAALATFDHARRTLAEAFGIDPGHRLTRLQQAMLRQDPSLDPPPDRSSLPPRGPAPPLGPTIGRTRELARGREALRSHRLVALLGPAGVGKSRLATELAAAVASAHPEDVVVVDLEEVSDAPEVAHAVAAAVGIDGRPDADDAAALTAWFARRDALLLLDGCEHVVHAVARLATRLLAASPGLTVLATSRVPLAVPGALDIPLRPLPAADAAELFRVRVREAGTDPATSHDARDAADAAGPPAVGPADPVSTVVDRLDGLPLAIELAAAWSRSMSPHQIAERLDRGGELLGARAAVSAGRVRTLREIVASSLDLLEPDEAELFRRLSVFVGRWTLHDAVAVCGFPPLRPHTVASTLARLVEHSLVVADGGRFHLLATIADVARERLDDAGAAAVLERRHGRHYLALASESERGLRGPDQARILQRLRGSMPDLTAALAWAHDHAEPDDILTAAAGLGWFWFLGRHGDGRRALADALAAAGHGSGSSAAARGRALQAHSIVLRPGGCIVHPDDEAHRLAQVSSELLAGAGCLQPAELSAVMCEVAAVGGVDVDGALRRLAAARRRCLDADDGWTAALADFVAMEIHVQQGAIEDALHVGERARAGFEAVRDVWGTSSVALHLGHGLRLAGRTDHAHALLEVGREEAARGGLRNTLAGIHDDLARIALHRNRLAATRRSVARLRSLADDLGNRMLRGAADVVEVELLQDRGRPGEARPLLRSATALLEDEGVPGGLAEALILTAVDEAGRGDLGAARRHGERARSLAVAMHDRGLQARSLEALALVAVARGDHTDAATALGRAASLRHRAGRPASRTERTVVERAAALGSGALGDGRFDELRAAAGARPAPGGVTDQR